MHCPALDDLVVSRVEVKENNSVKVIDLRLPENEMMQGDKRKENFKLLMTWPLIIACSIKTITPDAPFKFEYVHPQLLMLALKEKAMNVGELHTLQPILILTCQQRCLNIQTLLCQFVE